MGTDNFLARLDRALGTAQGNDISISEALNFNDAVERGDRDTAFSILQGADAPSRLGLENMVVKRTPADGIGWLFINTTRGK